MSTPAMESTIEANSKIYINYEAEIKRNDIIAFKVPSDLGTFFVFRMIGQPGDSLNISKGEIFINQILQKNPETLQFRYIIETERTINERFFNERGIKEFMPFEKGYMIFTTEQRATDLKEIELINAVTKDVDEPEYVDYGIFSDFQNANKDNLGNIYLPKAGETIDSKQLSRYATTILNHEGVDVSGLQEYTFKNSYCFVLGDNRDNALDSRYIGLVPMNKVMGAVNVLF
jgi:signal peptidase I